MNASLSRLMLLLYLFRLMISSPFGVMIGIFGTVITAKEGNTKRAKKEGVRLGKRVELTLVEALLVFAEDSRHDSIQEGPSIAMNAQLHLLRIA